MTFLGPQCPGLTDPERELIARYWDDSLDGDCTNFGDVADFLEPFLYTDRLKSQA